jgi:hypothetical protein
MCLLSLLFRRRMSPLEAAVGFSPIQIFHKRRIPAILENNIQLSLVDTTTTWYRAEGTRSPTDFTDEYGGIRDADALQRRFFHQPVPLMYGEFFSPSPPNCQTNHF